MTRKLKEIAPFIAKTMIAQAINSQHHPKLIGKIVCNMQDKKFDPSHDDGPRHVATGVINTQFHSGKTQDGECHLTLTRIPGDIVWKVNNAKVIINGQEQTVIPPVTSVLW